MAEKQRVDKTPRTRDHRDKKIERKLNQLSKDHPENEYEVKEVTVTDKKKNKDYKLIQIKRIKGRRPHKTKEQQKLSRESKKTRTVKV